MYLLEAKKKAEREAAVEDRKRALQRQKDQHNAAQNTSAQRAMEKAVSVLCVVWCVHRRLKWSDFSAGGGRGEEGMGESSSGEAYVGSQRHL